MATAKIEINPVTSMQKDYNTHSQAQLNIIKYIEGITLNATNETVDSFVKENGTYTVADYGSAKGTNSFMVITHIIEVFSSNFKFMFQRVIEKSKEMRDESYSKDIAFHIIHTDLPANDYSQLFANHRVFTTAAGIAANSINLGLCFTAIHWLSEKIQGCKACVYFSKHASIEENNKYSEVFLLRFNLRFLRNLEQGWYLQLVLLRKQIEIVGKDYYLHMTE